MPASHLPLLLFHLSVAYVVARRGWPLMAIGQRERRWIVGGAEQDVRCDGRQRGDFRRVQIEMGVVPQVGTLALPRRGMMAGMRAMFFSLGSASPVSDDMNA